MERLVAAMNFDRTDRVPVIAQVFGHAAVIAGVPLDEFIRDGELIAQCQLKALDVYGYDAVFSTMDVNVETEAIGSVLKYRKDQYATIEKYALTKDDDWGGISIPDPERSGRMPEMLKALRILRRELRDETLVVGCVTGPLTLTTQLLGMETALYLAIDEPDRFTRLMDFATDVLIRFGAAQMQAGAHLPIVFDPSASQAVVPHQFFREFELPCLKRLFGSFKRAGAAANWLHIAGPIESILPYYADAGVNIANFDYCITPKVACEKLPKTCLDGNIKPLSFVESAPDEITAEADMLLRSFAVRGGFILSSGCEIPPESRLENVEAMVMAPRKMR